MRLKEIAIEQRPRERLKSLGSETLSDAELLAILLQNGFQGENALDLSNRIISLFGIENLNSLSLTELMKIKGIGLAKASKLIAAFELSKRVNSGKICEKVISNTSDIANYYMEKLKDKKKEYFYALFLDNKNRIIEKPELISIGTLDETIIHPREVFKEAFKKSAKKVILIHNHPTEDTTPSNEDKLITEKMFKTGDMVGIEVTDHIIIGNNSYYSFRSDKVYYLSKSSD